MKVMHSEWRDRIRHWIRTLRDDLYEPLGDICFEAAHTMEYLTLEEAKKLETFPVSPGYIWGNTWEYGWFHAMITLPEQAKGERIVLKLEPGGESTLFVNDKSFGTYRADWIRYPHHYFEDNVLTRCAAGDETFDLWMETYAGHYYPEAPSGGCATGPVLPGAYQDPLKEGARRTLGCCTYGIWNEDAYQLLMDADTLLKLLDTLDPSSLRSARIARALEQFTLKADFEQERTARLASYREARAVLAPALRAVNGTSAPDYYAIGNAHLDLAWLWPMAETYRKTARTFAAQLRLLEEYPEYRFLQSQPAAYEMCREHYPELFERIRTAIRDGQWIAEGAMWVEPDTNMAGGEALIRQLVYGKKYYKDVLGVDSVVLWLPDTFGYTAALPQILLGTGVKYLVTQKIFWSYNEGDTFPYHYFTWEGMDGSKITAFLPTDYTYQMDPKTLNDIWKNRSQTRDLDAFLIPFGYGDGGGGPSRDYIEYALRERDMEGAPRVHMTDPVTFFEIMEAKGGPANTWTGELYFNAHRGTYTSQAAVKRNNRYAETALHNMELWGTISSLSGEDYDHEAAERLWKELLLHQFHDILPGSGIARMYHESNRRVGAVIREANKWRDRYLERVIAQGAGFARTDMEHTGYMQAETMQNESVQTETIQFESLQAESTQAEPLQTELRHRETDQEMAERAVTLSNSLSFETTQIVELPERFAQGAVYADGTPVEVMKGVSGVRGWVTVPSLGLVSIYPVKHVSDVQKCEEFSAVANIAAKGGSSAATRKVEKRELFAADNIEKKEDFFVTAKIEDHAFVLENDKLRISVNDRGEITSLIRKANGMEFAAAPMNHLRMFKDVPRKFDAWDIDSNYVLQEIPAADKVEVRILQEGLEAILEVKGTISETSYYTQKITLAAGEERVTFETDIEWHELHRLLKASFPTTIHASEGFNEIQFGYVKRPTTRSRDYDKDRFEVCNHRYSALHDGKNGAAILNDCKYGISMEGGELALTLLRAAASPEMRADNGHHHFTYAFTVWEGSFADGDVIRRGYELNNPVIVTEGAVKPYSFASVDQKNVLIEMVKTAEDESGDLILRLYEAAGAATRANLRIAVNGLAYEADMLEHITGELGEMNGVIGLWLRPFEIKTIRIRLR